MLEGNQSHASSYSIAPAFDAKQKKAVLQSILKNVADVDTEVPDVGRSLLDEVLESTSEEEGRPELQDEGVSQVIGNVTKGILKRPTDTIMVATRSNVFDVFGYRIGNAARRAAISNSRMLGKQDRCKRSM